MRHAAPRHPAGYLPTQIVGDGRTRLITPMPDLFTGIGVTTVKLCLGYEWDGVERRIGSPVMSLRDGSFDTSIWMVDLPRRGSGGGTVTPIVPSGDGPRHPSLSCRGSASRTTKET